MAALFALRNFARLPHPATSLPSSTLLLEHPKCIAVFDTYPKAQYHFLVLPRLPFSATTIAEREVDSLAALLRLPAEARSAVLDALAETAAEVVEMVKDEMGKTHGFEWGLNVGFHSVPSMRHLHLHVISDDLVSLSLKNKKHYNSFRPDLGFFVPLREVQSWVEAGADCAVHVEALRANEELLKTPLTCFKCGEAMGNMPALKRHLEDEWGAEKRKALAKAKR